MQISIVTPVYNAATFVTRAVESALLQPETAEILLIEDNSPDNSLEVCQALAKKYNKVKLLRHPGGVNLGAGASRNLGMQNASCDFIGFVDADNFYLPNRFSKTQEVFNSNPDCEGVYETIGNSIEDEVGLKRWIDSKRIPNKLTGLTSPVESEKLGEALITGRLGSLTLDGLVIKKAVLQKSGYMAEHLRLHQDTDFIIRVALTSKLLPADLSYPVALRGVHNHNRLSTPRSLGEEYRNKMKYWKSLLNWVKDNSDNRIKNLILDSIVSYTKSHKLINNFPSDFFPARLIWGVRLSRLILYPDVIRELVER